MQSNTKLDNEIGPLAVKSPSTRPAKLMERRLKLKERKRYNAIPFSP
ncbi:MAG TPA: hypothetical protein VFB28_04095 [Terriglobales bacterium]|nr:hypothetical protein [Terriglobales bacterium]